MEFESTLTIVSKSIDDAKDAFDVLIKRHKSVTADAWREIVSYDEPDKSFFCIEADRILFWTPEDRECEYVMEKIAGILGEDGFAMLILNNSVSPDCHDYKVTTPYGSCESGFDSDNHGEAFNLIKASYDKELVDLYRRGKFKGYVELWTKDRQSEPPMPYKRVSKPARSHEQVLNDDYLYRKSDESVEAFKSLLNNKKDLSAVYKKFSDRFEEIKANKDLLSKQDLYIVTKNGGYYNNALYEDVSLGTRLERAEHFSFYGKIFHIHGHSTLIQFQSIEIDHQMKELVCTYEDDLRLAIARRGGIIDDYDYNKLRYTDCCVMIDNEDQRYWNWNDKFSSDLNNYGLELIGRIAIWYAIINTPELSEKELKSLENGSFYLDAVEAKNSKVEERDKQLKAEAEERARQYEIQKQKDFEGIMEILKSKYSITQASTLAQIEREVGLGPFEALFTWSTVKKYITDKFELTPSVYFKNKGILRGVDTQKKAEQAQKAKERAEQAQARRIANQEALEQKEKAKRIKEAAKQEAQRIADEAKAKKQAEIQEARANAKVLYAPGEEPERIHSRIQTLMAKLDEAYPDHVIFNLGKDHKKWGETITELYRQLGYADNRSFLEAYGFTMDDSRGKGGRPTTLDPEAIIMELKRRYPNGAGNIKLDELKAANPDLPLKTLSNKASELLGMPLAKYLKAQGIL